MEDIIIRELNISTCEYIFLPLLLFRRDQLHLLVESPDVSFIEELAFRVDGLPVRPLGTKVFDQFRIILPIHLRTSRR